MALADTAKLIAELELRDKFSGPAAKINRSLSGLERGLGQTGRGMGQVAAGLGRIGVIGATVAAGGFIAVAKAAGDFETQLNTINTLVKLSDADLRTLGEGIRATFRETGEPLDELTAGYYDLLSAGIKLTDAQNALNLAVKLGIGGLGSTQEAVNLLTTAINTYKLDQAGAARAADVFAQTVADGVIKVSELQGAFADVAPIATTAGVSIEELGAAFATLTAKGALASEAGTQVNRAILELLQPTGDLAKIQERLGGSFADLIASKGLVETLELVRIEAEKNDQTFFDLFGRIEGAKAAINLTGGSLSQFRLELEKMHTSTGELNAQFAERQQGLNFQLGKLSALAQDAGITIGNALLPKLVPLIQKLNEFITKNQGKIAEFGEKLAAGFATFADRLQKADFSGAIATLKILGEVGKKVVDIFLSLPPGVQAAIVAGAAVNKLSGGLIGSGVGNIAGGIGSLFFDRFLARGSGPHNPVWVQSSITGGGGPGLLPFGLGAAAFVSAGVIMAGAFAQRVASDFLADNNPFDPGNKLDEFLGGDSVLTAALRDNTDAINSWTPLGQFDPSNRGGTRKQTGGAGKAGLPTLPDTAFDPGGGVVNLPDTAMSSLVTTATESKKLPPILTRQERATQVLQQRMAEARQAIHLSNSRLAVIAAKKFSSKTTVNVNVSTAVSVSNLQRALTSSRVATGTISEF